MSYGLFGKVPQKRDFMSVNMPSAVLTPFETWLQAAVAASRNELGRTWQDHYLVAPIWRFWIGPDILGTTVAGALMPSVDQVGRYFPLAIMYFAEDVDTLPPPLISPLGHWYAAIEQRLLKALSEETDGYLATILHGLERPYELQEAPFERPSSAPELPQAGAEEKGTLPPADAMTFETNIDEASSGAPVLSTPAEDVERIPEPATAAMDDLPDSSPFDDFPPEPEVAVQPSSAGPVAGTAFKGGQTIEVPHGQSLEEARVSLREVDYVHATGGRSYFWCAASQLGPARIHGRDGLPDPYFFSRMILWEGAVR